MFILWIILGVVIGLGFGFWTRTSRDEAIHSSWRARLVQAENTIDEMRAGTGLPAAISGTAEEDRGLTVLKEQLLKCQSERSVALAANDHLKDRIAELEGGRSANSKPRPPRAKKKPKTQRKAGSAPLPDDAAALAAATGIPAAAPDHGIDNLKNIKGIGPKLEKLLHSRGVYSFAQIAGWTPDQSARVDAQLDGFKGRIARDKWIAQARDRT